MYDFDNSGDPGPQAKAVNHVETPLRRLQENHRAPSCAERGGHVQLCSKPRGARGIGPETFRKRGLLVSRPPTTGPHFNGVGDSDVSVSVFAVMHVRGPLPPAVAPALIPVYIVVYIPVYSLGYIPEYIPVTSRSITGENGTCQYDSANSRGGVGTCPCAVYP